MAHPSTAGHVVIAGAGLGGLRAAEQLRAAGHAGPLTVIGAEPHLPYNRPPLSKELLAHELPGAGPGGSANGQDGNAQRGIGQRGNGETATAELAVLHERIAFRRRASVADVGFRLGTAIVAADLDGRRLSLGDGATVGFDGLVVATGLRPRRLGVPGPAGPGSGRHVIRTLDDCLELRADLRAQLQSPRAPRVVVVGGGFVGCEVACTVSALGCDVTVIEPAGPPMLRVLGDELATAIQRHHERAGIRFLTGVSVLAYTGLGHTGLGHAPLDHTALDLTGPDHARGRRVTGVVVGDSAEPGGTEPAATDIPGGPISGGPALAGAVLPADIVVEAVGSVPNTEWLAGTGLDISDGVLVDNSLAAIPGTTSTAAGGTLVVAVGDVARFPNPLFDDIPRRVEHWSMPTDTARRAAATLVGRLAGAVEDTGPFGPIPSFWSDQGELRLQSFGSPALADDIRLAEGDPGEPRAGLLAEYYRGGRNVGSVAVNLPPSRQRELRAALAAATATAV